MKIENLKKEFHSSCGMCAARCPVTLTVNEETNSVKIQGNKSAGQESICIKGAAAEKQRTDDQRPKKPMIRTGPRGGGQWKEVEWEEALDYVASKSLAIKEQYGGKSFLFSDRGGPFSEFRKAFAKAVGSATFCDHDQTCGRNTHHASLSLYGKGIGRVAFSYDYTNASHAIFFGRNIEDTMTAKEKKSYEAGKKNGMKITYIDPRKTKTGEVADRYWQNRPGTDYALLLGITNTIINNNLYDIEFSKKYINGIPELKKFLEPYTAEWAEKETGIKASEIRELCKELNDQKPKVIFHPGWMLARYKDSMAASRMLHTLNALMGNIETEGGLYFAKGPKDAGKAGLKSLSAHIPEVTEPRADGCGTTYPHFDKNGGMLQFAFDAIETEKPYPVKAYFAHRHNPLVAMPDPEALKRKLSKLDLIVSVDIGFSETAWYADVILPESTFMERGDILFTENGLKPGFARREACIAPLNDTKPGWMIYLELAKKMGLGHYFPYETLQEIQEYQLQGTGIKLTEFDEKGFVKLTEKPIYFDRDNLKFGNPSGKIEIVNDQWEKMGIPSLEPYVGPVVPQDGSFRLLFGRVKAQTHAMHHNHPSLSKLLKENSLTINTVKAEELGITNGETVEILNGDVRRVITANVSAHIHPEAVYMDHGFGTDVPAQERAYGKGVADHIFMVGKQANYDKAGGCLNLCESFVMVRKLTDIEKSEKLAAQKTRLDYTITRSASSLKP